jgi:hypothetical protein
MLCYVSASSAEPVGFRVLPRLHPPKYLEMCVCICGHVCVCVVGGGGGKRPQQHLVGMCC